MKLAKQSSITLLFHQGNFMQKSKIINKEKYDPRKVLVGWLAKIKFLKDQIEKLEQLKDLVIISIAVFLLKSQIIEFELKQIIFSLDLHLYSQNRSKLVNRLIRRPKDLDGLTLGELVREFKQFITSSEPPVLVDNKVETQDKNGLFKELKQDLTLLVKKRNEFTHRLFSLEKDVSILTKEAQEGIKIANKTLKLLEVLEIELKNYEK